MNTPLFTFACEANSNLITLGARALDAEFSPLIPSLTS
jgi:hypothetical protein